MSSMNSKSINDKSKRKEIISWLEPLSPRIKGDVKGEESLLKKSFFVISPVIIYMLYVGLLTGTSQIVLSRIADSKEEYARYISANKTVINACIRTVVILIATAMQIPALRGEKPVIVSDDGNPARYIKSILLGIFTAVTLNVLLILSGFTGSSETFGEVADKQFAVPFGIGILLYGIVSPLAEEVVFRGLVYNRMRRNGMYVIPAMLISSMLFGAYHFNIVQAVYGTLMGLLIVWVYERYGGFLYPVVFHAAANIVIFSLSSLEIMNKIMTPVTVIVTGAVAAFLSYLISQENKS